MKLIKGILGCALAAGLVTFAPSKAQAQGGEIFTPLNLKLVVFYTTGNGKIHKLRINSKDILKELSTVAYDGEDFKGDKLATLVGNVGGGTESVFIIHGKNTVLEIPSEDGFMALGLQELVDSEKDSTHSFKYGETGLIALNFYSNPQFTDEETVLDTAVSEPTPIEPFGFDQAASEDASDIWMEFTGDYVYKEKGHDGKNAEHLSTHLKAVLTGQGFNSDLDDSDVLPVDGKLSGSASGNVEVD